MTFKIMCALILISLILSALSSCGGNIPKTDETSAFGNDSVSEKASFKIDGTDISDFVIVRSDTADEDITALSVKLRKRLSDMLGTEISLTTDWTAKGEALPEHKISVGMTKNYTGPSYDGAYYCCYDGNIIFDGGDVYDTAAAIDVFLTDYFGTSLDSEDSISISGDIPDGTAKNISYTYQKQYINGEENMNTKYQTNENFAWGINGHNRAYSAYPEKYLDQQIGLAAQLGSQIYRFNFNPQSDEDFAYMDKAVKLCGKYGMDMMLVLDDMSGTPDEIYARHKKIAERYSESSPYGHIKYYQIFNETDVYAMHNDDGSMYHSGDGADIGDFNPVRVEELCVKLLASQKAFREIDPSAKLVVNFAWLHTAILKAYADAGIEWDITGIDWYSDMEGGSSISYITDVVGNMFPERQIIICECNIWAHNQYTEDEQAKYMSDFSDKVYSIAANNDKFIGLIVYELLDEMNFESDKYEGEAHFGLVNCETGGKIGSVKNAYSVLRDMWTGGEINFRTIEIS